MNVALSHAWVGVVGVVVGAALSSGITYLRDRMMAKVERARALARMEFERSERRHDDIRTTYSAFMAAASTEYSRAWRHIERHQETPAATYGEIVETSDGLSLALGALELFAPDDTRAAARAYVDILWEYVNQGRTHDEVRAAAHTVSELARRDLRGAVNDR